MRSAYKRTQYPFRISIAFATVTLLLSASCSTVVDLPEKPPLPEIPDYVKVPHPAGFDLADLKTIFFSPLAPKGALGEFADICDEDFKKLSDLTRVPEERRKGAEELVSKDPERMHWCFYAKISRLQDVLQADTTWSTRQKKVLEAFDFISPVAKAYLEVYRDSRYLRWATQYYTKISEWVFFKKVVPTPGTSTAALMKTPSTSLEPWVTVPQDQQAPSIFTKYGIALAPSATSTASVNPTDEKSEALDRAPASNPDLMNDAPPAVVPLSDDEK